MGEEPKRKFTRWGVALPCLFRYDGQIHKAQVHDLSEGGAFLEASACPPVGSEVPITLRTAEGTRQFSVRAVVRHQAAIRGSKGRLIGFGVEFAPMSEATAGDIEKLIIRYGQITD